MIKNNLNIQHSGVIGNSVSPTKSNSFVSLGGVDYLMGALFILLGILIFVLYYKKSKLKYDNYKKEQLALYNKNKGTKITDYKKTKLYVPFWNVAKASTPVMSTALFIMMGIL